MDKLLAYRNWLEARAHSKVLVLQDYVDNFTPIGEHSMSQYYADLEKTIDEIDADWSRMAVIDEIVEKDTAAVGPAPEDN